MSFGKVWKSRVIKTLCGLGLAMSVTAVSPDASAQEVDVRRVLELIGQANDHFESEEYAKALATYKEAYAQYPDPSLLYRIGLTSEKLEQNFEAVEYYAKFIDAVPDDKTAKRVKERITELQAELPARYLVESTPQGATIYVGSRQNPVGVTPAQIDVEPGTTVVMLDLEDYEAEVRTVDAVRGETSTLSFELQKARVSFTPPPKDVSESSDGVGLATWGWITTGLGVATLATGGAFTFLSMNATDDVNSYNKQDPGATRDELSGMKDDALFYYDTSVILYAAGGILTAAGVTMLVLDLASEDNQASVTVSPTRGGMAVGIGGSF